MSTFTVLECPECGHSDRHLKGCNRQMEIYPASERTASIGPTMESESRSDLSQSGWDRAEQLAAEAGKLKGVIDGLLRQFDHTGCTCTFQSDDCCAYARATALQRKWSRP